MTELELHYLQEIITTGIKIISLVAAGITFLWNVHKYALKPIIEFFRKQDDYNKTTVSFIEITKKFQEDTKKTLLQLSPNGNTSIHDRIRIIQQSTEDIKKDLNSVKLKVFASYELNPNAMFECDKQGHCTKVNKAWSLLTGMDSSASAGYGWLNSIHEDDRERIKEEWETCLEGNEQCACDYRVKHVITGEVTPINARSVILKDGGTVVGIIGILEPVSKKKKVITG